MCANNDDLFDRFLGRAMEVAILSNDMITLYKLESVFYTKFESYLKDKV